jgi:predicted nucleic acid-binding protein
VIVADTNLIVYAILRSVHTRQAEAVLRADSAWHAPFLWRSEFCHVLVKQVRDGRIDAEDAPHVLARAEVLMLGGEHDVGAEDVLRLALSTTCSAYDCEFVALAQDLGVPLVTSDKQVLRAFPDVAVSPTRFIG